MWPNERSCKRGTIKLKTAWRRDIEFWLMRNHTTKNSSPLLHFTYFSTTAKASFSTTINSLFAWYYEYMVAPGHDEERNITGSDNAIFICFVLSVIFLYCSFGHFPGFSSRTCMSWLFFFQCLFSLGKLCPRWLGDPPRLGALRVASSFRSTACSSAFIVSPRRRLRSWTHCRPQGSQAPGGQGHRHHGGTRSVRPRLCRFPGQAQCHLHRLDRGWWTLEAEPERHSLPHHGLDSPCLAIGAANVDQACVWRLHFRPIPLTKENGVVVTSRFNVPELWLTVSVLSFTATKPKWGGEHGRCNFKAGRTWTLANDIYDKLEDENKNKL